MAKPKFISLPIYSICSYKMYIYISGGGGGKTGIPNEMWIFKGGINKEPVKKISTGDHICENLIADDTNSLFFCSAANKVRIYRIADQGLSLDQIQQFQADFADKNPTVNSLTYSPKSMILASGGDDAEVRFWKVQSNNMQVNLAFSHFCHQRPVKSTHNNNESLFTSNDNLTVAVCNPSRKEVIRRISCDQLLPKESFFHSAHFYQHGSDRLVLTHYIARKAGYVSREDSAGKFTCIEVSKDQPCATAYHSMLKLLGIACGNGSTCVLNAQHLEVTSKNKPHSFVITACSMTRNGLMITGTPQCSYNIQNAAEFSLPIPWKHVLSVVICLLFMWVCISDLNLFGEL